MELMTGGDLFDLIRKKKYLNETEASKIISQILSAVAFLHKNGVIHTDIKADNTLLNFEHDEPAVKLADFGFAQKIGNGKSNTPCGSFIYSAPEIIKQQSYDKSVDIWSVGVLLYILLCGFPPFYDEDQEKLIEYLSHDPILEFPYECWRHVSSEAKDLIGRMLKIDPVYRISADAALHHPWILKHEEICDGANVSRSASSRSIGIQSVSKLSSHILTENNTSSHALSTESSSALSSSSEEEVLSFCVHDGEFSSTWGS
eukprot:TRINITY_DN8296_c0_g1_i1.p1 TRINITY_DN8296_c0_g1~~TRINITY_DN8296_c0_g1_i1.p1  ORF type:complete len:259 (+),score=50.44 TRINITY_DN8296_c0_g1_i1:389-1165(+)